MCTLCKFSIIYPRYNPFSLYYYYSYYLIARIVKTLHLPSFLEGESLNLLTQVMPHWKPSVCQDVSIAFSLCNWRHKTRHIINNSKSFSYNYYKFYNFIFLELFLSLLQLWQLCDKPSLKSAISYSNFRSLKISVTLAMRCRSPPSYPHRPSNSSGKGI